MMKDFNENWSALLKSTISTGIDDVIFYKKILSDEQLKIKYNNDDNYSESLNMLGKKSGDKNVLEQDESKSNKISNFEEISSKKHKKESLINDENIEFESDEEDQREDNEDDNEDKSEEISDSFDENTSEKEKFITRDEVLNTIFDRKNKENTNNDDFIVKKVIYSII